LALILVFVFNWWYPTWWKCLWQGKRTNIKRLCGNNLVWPRS